MKQATIYCRELNRGTLYFYVSMNGEEHYLFGQSFRLSLWNRYRYSVRLDDALDWGKCRTFADRKVCEKLFKNIPYIEKEYGLVLLRKSRKSSRRTVWEDDETAA